MKKIIKKIIITLAILVSVLSMLLIGSLIFRPIGNVVFSVTLGSMYHKAGDVTLKFAEQDKILAIYKASDKPFLLIGPYRFNKEDDYEDFFFVSKKRIIRTTTDKGADDWVRIFSLLFILDDMTFRDRVRSPYWDDLKCDPDSSIRHDEATSAYIYSYKINATIPVSFSIPSKLFTADMPDADHFVFND